MRRWFSCIKHTRCTADLKCFAAPQEFAGQLLFDDATLRSSVTSLRELEFLRVPGLLGGPAFSLTRFSRLRCLNLVRPLPIHLCRSSPTKVAGIWCCVPCGPLQRRMANDSAIVRSPFCPPLCTDCTQGHGIAGRDNDHHDAVSGNV